jgi:poly(A) polymerase Pap1
VSSDSLIRFSLTPFIEIKEYQKIEEELINEIISTVHDKDIFNSPQKSKAVEEILDKYKMLIPLEC